MKKVFVVTLEAGEAEFESCVESLLRQEGIQIEHRVFRNLPKQEAHQRLFEAFNEHRGQCDFFLKLDADMVLAQNNSLVRMLQSFEPDVDAVSYTVWDRLTQDRMWSVNLYRSTCIFDAKNNDSLFTDRLKVCHTGRKVSIVDRENLVLHAPSPSDFQAFMFGIHRSFKVVQPNLHPPRLEAAYHQMKILRKVAKNFKDHGDNKAKIALLGAEMVLSGKIAESTFYQKEFFSKYFERADLKGHNAQLNFIGRSRSALGDVFRLYGFSKFKNASISYVRRKGVGAGGNRLHAGGPGCLPEYRAGKGAPAGIGRAAKMIGAGFFRRLLQLLGDGQTRRRNGARGRGAADLVINHADLVAGVRQAQHGFDKIRTMSGKHPRGAQNGMGAAAGANALFARPFAAAIGIGGLCHITGRPSHMSQTRRAPDGLTRLSRRNRGCAGRRLWPR